MMDMKPGLLMAQLLNRFIWFDGALQKSLDARGHGGVRRLESMTMILFMPVSAGRANWRGFSA